MYRAPGRLKELAQGIGLRSSILERDLKSRKGDCLSKMVSKVILSSILTYQEKVEEPQGSRCHRHS